MDFIKPGNYKCVNYYTILRDLMTFTKILKANYEEQTVEIISFLTVEPFLVKEFTRL